MKNHDMEDGEDRNSPNKDDNKENIPRAETSESTGNLEANKKCLICLSDMIVSNSRSIDEKAKQGVIEASNKRF